MSTDETGLQDKQPETGPHNPRLYVQGRNSITGINLAKPVGPGTEILREHLTEKQLGPLLVKGVIGTRRPGAEDEGAELPPPILEGGESTLGGGARTAGSDAPADISTPAEAAGTAPAPPSPAATPPSNDGAATVAPAESAPGGSVPPMGGGAALQPE